MKLGVKLSTILAGVAAGLAVMLVAAPAAADPSDDKARVEREIAKTKAALEAASEQVAAAAEAYERANQLLPGVRRKLADAKAVVSDAKAHAATMAKRAERAGADLDRADRALALAVQRVDESREVIGRFARDAYTGGSLAQIDALLRVGSPGDFVAGLTYMEHVNARQQAALDANLLARTDKKHKQDAQIARKREADAAKAEADTAVREAEAAQVEAARAQRRVADLVAQRKRALAVAENEKDATEKRYQQLQAESQRIADEIRKLADGSGPVVRAGARLPMPVNGWKSSDFGWRYDPFYQKWQLHAGVDLAAPGGSSIWAAAAGRVFRAGWNGGYGNYTCLYHGTYQGKGFATCYAHQSKILVAVNQQVRQGQLIGRVGTTGASTGNHLHFEVRLDGEPVDPLPWLPKCLC